MTLSNYSMKARYTRNLIQRGVKVRDASVRRGFHDYTMFYNCNYILPSCNHRVKYIDSLLRNGFCQINRIHKNDPVDYKLPGRFYSPFTA